MFLLKGKRKEKFTKIELEHKKENVNFFWQYLTATSSCKNFKVQLIDNLNMYAYNFYVIPIICNR